MPSDYLEVVAKRLMGKIVEVYQGVDHRQHTGYADNNHCVKSVILGKLVEVDECCLIVEVTRGKDTGLVYINSWSINTICEPGSGISTEDAHRPSTDIAGNRKRDKVKEFVGKAK
jgi:hypothetical protein